MRIFGIEIFGRKGVAADERRATVEEILKKKLLKKRAVEEVHGRVKVNF